MKNLAPAYKEQARYDEAASPQMRTFHAGSPKQHGIS
jgi:hypothetical protein